MLQGLKAVVAVWGIFKVDGTKPNDSLGDER